MSMKNMWNWPTNRARNSTDLTSKTGASTGYMADTANWSNDNSYGMDQRINELLTGNYKAWANLDPVANLNMTVDVYNELFAKWKDYFESHGDASHLSFYQMHRHPAVIATTYKIAPQIYMFDSYLTSGGDLIWRAHTDRAVNAVFVSGTDNYVFNHTTHTRYDTIGGSASLDMLDDIADGTSDLYVGPLEKNTITANMHVEYMSEKAIYDADDEDQSAMGHAYQPYSDRSYLNALGQLQPFLQSGNYDGNHFGLYQAANATTPYNDGLEFFDSSPNLAGWIVNYRDFENEAFISDGTTNAGNSVVSAYIPGSSSEATGLPDDTLFTKFISPGNNQWVDYPVAPNSTQKQGCFNDCPLFYRKGSTENTLGHKFVTFYDRSKLPADPSASDGTGTFNLNGNSGQTVRIPAFGDDTTSGTNNDILTTFYALLEVPLVNSSGSNSTVSLDALDVSDTSSLTLTDQDGTAMSFSTLRTFLDAQTSDLGLARVRVDATSNGIGSIFEVGSSSTPLLDVFTPRVQDPQFYIPAEDTWNTNCERALYTNVYDGSTAGSETLHIGKDFSGSTPFRFDIQDGANGTLYVAIMNPPTPKADTKIIRHTVLAPTNFYKSEDTLSTEALPDNSNWSVAWHAETGNTYSKSYGQFFNIFTPGDIQYSYLDSGGSTVYGIKNAGYDGQNTYWPAGASSAKTYNGAVLDPDFTRHPNVVYTVNGSGYLATVATSIGSGSPINWYEPTANAGVAPYGAMQSVGIFDCHEDVLLPLEAKDNEYVAPTPYAEDVWDTDDEWDSDGVDGGKRWPTHVAPAGARMVVTQPSSVTRSQNGTKYVRSSGVIRQQLELTYPPMPYDDFREFEAVVEAARGQATPLFLQVKNLGDDSANILLQRTDANKDGGLTGSTFFRVREAISVGDKTILAEGFPGNQTDALVRGEYLVGGLSYGNGDLIQVVNDNIDSNIYGEVKFRIPYGSKQAVAVGNQFYKNPFHIIVSISDDEFEYSVGTDGLYRFTCRFDFDEFK